MALSFAAVVLLVFMITNFINFSLVATFNKAKYGGSCSEAFQTVYLNLLPSEFATALLTAGVAFSYDQIGVGAVGLRGGRAVRRSSTCSAPAIQAFERGEELSKRTRELASLQVGLLTTVLQTLSMRDAMTARHSAAVARYSREVAKMMGLTSASRTSSTPRRCFTTSASSSSPTRSSSPTGSSPMRSGSIVKLHPEQGAKLVRRIEGYGPVADIIYCHHERYDGNGYYNVPLEDIPLGSRIIAAADTYDVMTSRDSYRRPVSSEAALAELRRVAGAQLDPLVVETFETHDPGARRSRSATPTRRTSSASSRSTSAWPTTRGLARRPLSWTRVRSRGRRSAPTTP